MNIAISSGHAKNVRGASGYLDEVDEARRVVNKVCDYLDGVDVLAYAFHDDASTSQNENLNRIVDFHNKHTRELDVSVHFNAFETTGAPMGTECLYLTLDDTAGKMAGAIADASGLKNRGAKKRTDLFFLNKTEEPAILIEVCFVDSTADAGLYEANFDGICRAIAEQIAGKAITEPPGTNVPPPDPDDLPVIPIVTISISPPGSVAVQITGDAPLHTKD